MNLRSTVLLSALAGLGACAPPPAGGVGPEQTQSRLQTEKPGCREDDDVVTCLQRFASTPTRTFTARADCSVFTERGDSVSIEPTTRAARQVVFPVRARESGMVRLQMQVDTGGRLLDVRVVQSSGNALLEAAAMDAAQEWCYLPAHRNGRDEGGAVEAVFRFNVIRGAKRDNESSKQTH